MIFIDQQEPFERAMSHVAAHPVVAVDTEADSLHSYFDKVCLIQMSVPDEDLIIDPLRKIDLARFGQILADRLVVEDPDRPIPVEAEARGSARIVREVPERVEVVVEAESPAYLLLADSYDPGWSATVDGQPRPIRPAYAALLGATRWGHDLLDVGVGRRHARHFGETGISIVRNDDTSLVFMHGPQHRLLFSHGHMHADAGSFELEQDGVPIVIDAGPYVYFAPRTAGRGRMRFVPAALVEVVRRCVHTGAEVEAMLAEISAINAELLARRELT